MFFAVGLPVRQWWRVLGCREDSQSGASVVLDEAVVQMVQSPITDVHRQDCEIQMTVRSIRDLSTDLECINSYPRQRMPCRHLGVALKGPPLPECHGIRRRARLGH
jgi:hypothetical protein